MPEDPPPVTGPLALDLPRRRLDLTCRVGVMGIINRTPDSFYDGGRTYELDAALELATALVAEGADILDVGGVKGGPGAEVTTEEEIERVVPFIESFRAHDPATLLSVDTFRAPVAAAALAAGADIINDVTGLHDPEVLDVVADNDAGYVAMHHGGRPRTRPFRRSYAPDVTAAVVAHCRALTERALAAGVPGDRLIVDPGHDFQKTTAHSLELSRRLLASGRELRYRRLPAIPEAAPVGVLASGLAGARSLLFEGHADDESFAIGHIVVASAEELANRRKVARASEELDRETTRGTPQPRARLLAWGNDLRAGIGLPPLPDEDEDPPELEF